MCVLTDVYHKVCIFRLDSSFTEKVAFGSQESESEPEIWRSG